MVVEFLKGKKSNSGCTMFPLLPHWGFDRKNNTKDINDIKNY